MIDAQARFKLFLIPGELGTARRSTKDVQLRKKTPLPIRYVRIDRGVFE